MKRHRVLGFDFDTRVRSLDPIPDEWEEQVKALHRDNRARTIQGLQEEFGIRNFDQKLQNFIDLGSKSFSIIAFHNRFYAQARSAFVQCQYYPALTGVCALGERVLNHLVLGLREHYKASPYYKRVYRKDSFDNWDLALDALRDWQVLTTTAEVNFGELLQRRNDSIHFNAGTERSDREDALGALLTFGRILEAQFASFGALPWLFTPPGEVYVRKEWEQSPFVQLVYVPNSRYVGHKHRVVNAFPWKVEDTAEYASEEVSDDEFTKLRAEARSAG